MKKLHQYFVFFLIIALFFCYPFVFYYTLFYSPSDHLHGEFVKIMYIHVPSAWLSIVIYCLMGLFSLLCLWLSSPLMGLIAYALAPIGITFTAICLITGSLWGKPIWVHFGFGMQD